LCFVIHFSGVAAQELFDFVPESAGYFVVLRSMRSTLETLRDSTNFFGAYLGDEGFGAERALYGIIDATGYNAEVDTSLLKDALNRDLLLAGEGLELSLEDLLTFDPFYLLEKLKLSRARIFIVWKSESSFTLLKAVAALLDMTIFAQPGESINELRSNSGTLFYYTGEGFLIIGGNREAVQTALNTYQGQERRLLESSEKGREIAEMSYDYTITGFFDSDRFKIDLGLQSPFSVDNTVVFARPEGHTLAATIVQDTIFLNSQDLEVFLELADTKENEASEKTFGDYTVFFPSSSVETLRNELTHWFELDLEPYRELADYIVLLSRESTGNARIYGELVSEVPKVSAVFKNRNGDTSFLESPLKEWGAKTSIYRGNRVYELENDFDTIYFIFSPATTVLTTLTPEEYYSTVSSSGTLRDNVSYEFVRELGMEKDIVEAFVDVKKIFKSLIGITLDSAIFYQQTFLENGKMVHALRFY